MEVDVPALLSLLSSNRQHLSALADIIEQCDCFQSFSEALDKLKDTSVLIASVDFPSPVATSHGKAAAPSPSPVPPDEDSIRTSAISSSAPGATTATDAAASTVTANAVVDVRATTATDAAAAATAVGATATAAASAASAPLKLPSKLVEMLKKAIGSQAVRKLIDAQVYIDQAYMWAYAKKDLSKGADSGKVMKLFIKLFSLMGETITE